MNKRFLILFENLSIFAKSTVLLMSRVAIGLMRSDGLGLNHRKALLY